MSHPSRHHPFAPVEAEVSYVTDNEDDAEALCRQTGQLVTVRRWVLEEVQYLGAGNHRRKTSLMLGRLERPDALNVNQKPV